MRQFLLFVFTIVALSSNAQILEPVEWSFSQNALSSNEHELIFTAKIDDEWTVYSQFTSDDGPVPTEIVFENIEGAELIGKASEKGHKKEGLDKLFDVNVIKYLGDEDFVIKQKIKVSDYSKQISGYLTFMTCNNKTCLPPTDIDFSFTLKGGTTNNGAGGSAQPEQAKNAGGMKFSSVEDKSVEKKAPTFKLNNSDSDLQIKTIKAETKPAKTKNASTYQSGDMTVVLDTKKQQDVDENLLSPVQWVIGKKKISDTEYDLIYTADIDDEWTVYSQFTSDDGPVPTQITYENSDGVELIGKATEKGHKKEGLDKLFDVNVIKYLGDEDFVITQRIKVIDESKPLAGYLTFMTCNNVTCLPPTDIEFDFGMGAASNIAGSANANASSLAGPQFIVTPDGKVDQTRANIISTLEAPLSDCGSDSKGGDEQSLLWLLIAGILGGFAALLTPCVFPMIPITVSFFTKDTKRKGWMNGLIYGASIIVIYVVLGLIITIALGPEALQALSTNWIANVLFFLIFLFFAGSFFGFYELTLPSSWTNKSDRMADKGGLLGIFFMAATLALVSFSCTGPIVGSALVAAANGGFVGPLVVMFGFSAALALPFGLFAAFPAWLNSLPKSGGWMNSVKVVLGFLEVGAAFKFLSTADLTQHWGILKYEIFMLILILVCIAISLYLFGFIKFPHDSPIKKLSLPRMGIGSAFALLAIYLGFGFTVNKDTGIYNSLSLTSGFSPPVMYNMFLDKGEVDPDLKKRYPSLSKCANNIDCFKDYYEGMAYAKEIGKPAFIDFTGHGCQNCRRTEDRIWVNDKIRQSLNDDVVLISLYTDDREKLPEAFISLKDDKKKRTVGTRWADFQVVNFAQNSQPLYIMMTPDEKVITQPRGYEDSVDGYQKYLECGLDYFNK